MTTHPLHAPAWWPGVVCDGLRVAALISLVLGLVGYGPVAGAVFFLVLGGVMVPRATGAPWSLDGAYCAAILLAAWAAVLNWYVVVPWLDVVVHAAATGLVAAMAQWGLVRLGVASVPGDGQLRFPRAAMALQTASTGVVLAVVWELGEWWGHTYLDARIQVGYTDTIGDISAGAVGAVLAGVLLGGGLLRRGSR